MVEKPFFLVEMVSVNHDVSSLFSSEMTLFYVGFLGEMVWEILFLLDVYEVGYHVFVV